MRDRLSVHRSAWRIVLPGAAASALAAALIVHPVRSAEPARPFTAHDLVTMDRVSDPHLSPDGRQVAYQLRETDLDANKGVTSLWLAADGAVRALTAPGDNSSARWRHDGTMLYFLSSRSGSKQVWRLDLHGGDAQQVTHVPLDIGSFVLSPDARHLLVSIEVFQDCDTLECSRQRLDAQAMHKSAGQTYDRLFARHWDRWSDGTRSQLFAFALDEQGNAQGAPLWISRGMDADIPSKPEGDDSEYTFTPDSREVVFAARVAGRTEAWSTNFDLYRRPLDADAAPSNLTADNPAADTDPVISPDGKTLAYLAARRPGFESDRNAVMLKDLSSGRTRELLPDWDRSAESLKWSVDGKTLYALADEKMQHRLFAIDVARAQVSALTDQGTVGAYDVGVHGPVIELSTLGAPSQIFRVAGAGRPLQALTHVDAGRLGNIALSDYEAFEFPGWNQEKVQGFVMKPTGYQPGKKYPVAFIIHGGPESPFGNVFHYRWNAQAFAGAGFAVVAIEFHGTPGYGQAFTDSIIGHWGDRPLEDLQKGWQYALEHYAFLDGGNACALGASYGGYMVDWIAGNWPAPQSGPWKCLISHDGVFDTRLMYFSTDELWFTEAENQGTPWEHPENFERFNPVDHVGQWQVPMLVIQGGQDFRVPIEEGLGAFTALQRREIPSELLYFPDENHWVLKPRNSLQWYDTVLRWMKQHTG